MKTRIIGIGSTIRGDDGVGVHIVRRLRDHAVPNTDILELGTAGIGLIDFIDGYDRLIIIDAIVTGAPPGTVFELTGDDVVRSVHLNVGHETDFSTALALGVKLLEQQTPKHIVVLAVEAKDLTTFTEHLTPEVESAIPQVLERLKQLAGFANKNIT